MAGRVKGYRNKKLFEGVPHRRCTKCLEWYPEKEQWFYRNGEDFRSICKACHCIATEKRYKGCTPEKIAKSLQYYYEHHEEILEKRRLARYDRD